MTNVLVHYVGRAGKVRRETERREGSPFSQVNKKLMSVLIKIFDKVISALGKDETRPVCRNKAEALAAKEFFKELPV